MRIDLNHSNLIEINVDTLGLILPGDQFPETMEPLDQALGGQLSCLWRSAKPAAKEIPVLHTCGRATPARILLVKHTAGCEARELRTLYITLGKKARQLETETLAVNLPGVLPAAFESQLAVEGLSQGAYLPDLYKHQRKPSIQSLLIWSESQEAGEGSRHGEIVAAAQKMARNLVNEPPAKATPTYLLEEAYRISTASASEIEVLDANAARKKGMGAFCAVAQGSSQPAFMVRLHHPGTSSVGHLALVGKGLTFDSGGLSLKPWESMITMKSDMAGAATVLAAYQAICILRPELEFSVFAPLTENLLSGHSFKPGDVLEAMNGKTIEVRSTDAEGRLILADALCWAQECGATHLVDVATLTGACIIALGYETVGLFTNQSEWGEKLLQAAEKAGERLWRMPMFPEYKELNNSEIADLANSAGRGGAPAGAIAAACFLQEFIGEGVTWAHLDIAGPAFLGKENRAQAGAATGAMVRTLIELGLAF
jgi:leucyl aminopeptidase